MPKPLWRSSGLAFHGRTLWRLGDFGKVSWWLGGLSLLCMALASIAKMGYKDHNNDGKFVKVHGVDDEEKENAPTEDQAQDPAAPTLAQVFEVLG